MASNQNPNEMFETVSGLLPDTKKLPYQIKTEKVQEVLNKKLAALKAKVDPDGAPIELKVYSIESSKSFIPFIVSLSMSAAESNEERQKNNVNPFFTSEGNGKNFVKLKEYVRKFFSNYVYSKDDVHAFDSDDWRRSRGVSRQTAVALRSLSTPKLMTKSRENLIYFLIDPIRVFFDMLRINNDANTYKVRIESWQKRDASNYTYRVVREVSQGNNNKGYGKSFIDEVNYRMRTGNNH